MEQNKIRYKNCCCCSNGH